MKKILIALLIFSTTPVLAESWTAIGENNESGKRLLIDMDSFNVYDDQKSIYIKADFEYFKEKESAIVANIDVKNCSRGEGVLTIIPLHGKNTESLDFYYSESGNKMYDYVGQKLCEFWAALKENSRPNFKKSSVAY